jgi:hypothetical protein
MLRATTAIACALALSGASCAWHQVIEPRLHERSSIPSFSKEDAHDLKVHMLNGDLFMLRPWRLSDDGHLLVGKGQRFDTQRARVGEGEFRIAVDDVALVESSNNAKTGFGSSGLAFLTTTFGAIATVCAIDPKSCFGSCPAFYVNGHAGAPDAEGFSQSIARVLEARDVDALPSAHPKGGHLSILMRNEALETHAVRRVRLLAATRPSGSRVLATPDGRFFLSDAWTEPLACQSAEGDCRAAVKALDRNERTSPANPDDLAARETIDLVFPDAPPRAGVVIAARQTLLTTFVFYQTLAYLGSHAGDWLATLERGGPAAGKAAMAMARRLGGIDVHVEQADGTWCHAGGFEEAGPIAGDLQVIPIERCALTPGAPVHVRLRLTQGHWRLDWVALARLDGSVTPVVYEADRVERDGRPQVEALASLRGEGRRLITQPGDSYLIHFRLPKPEASEALEVFLESEGFYYEWMRQEWLRDEDAEMARLIFANPAEALRRLAPEFKAREAHAEEVFWNSRVGR